MRRLALGLCLCVLLLGTRGANAATLPPKLSGIAVSPAVQQLVVSPQQDSYQFAITVYNYTNQTVRLQVQAIDFTSFGESGGISFVNTAQGASQSHGLKQALQLPESPLELAANTSQQVPITITNVQQLSDAGHYAALVVQQLPNDGAATNKVQLNEAVSSLVFVETAGQGDRSLRLLAPSVPRLAFSLPSTANLVFAATGNTQTLPRGVVGVVHGGQLLEQGIINANSSLILPGGSRLLPASMYGQRHPWAVGRYTLRVQYRYEGSQTITTYERQFLYINPWEFAAAILLAILTLGAVWWYWPAAVRKVRKIFK